MKRSMARSRRRHYKRAFPIKRVLSLMLCVLALSLFARFYVGRYRTQLAYQQYPLSYKDEIVRAAQTYELDPWHVAAVIRCESSFNAQATSSAGARGLMQIMPETGEWLAKKFGEEDTFTADALYDPETSIKYGCWFLNWLMQHYQGDLVLVSCAYHAGHRCVDGWLEDEAVSPDGQSIDVSSIPYDSTRTYVQRILTACEKYKALYDF